MPKITIAASDNLCKHEKVTSSAGTRLAGALAPSSHARLPHMTHFENKGEYFKPAAGGKAFAYTAKRN